MEHGPFEHGTWGNGSAVSTLSGCKAADPNAPPPRSNHTTSLHENSVVLFGGHGGFPPNCLPDERKVMKGDGYVKSIRISYKDHMVNKQTTLPTTFPGVGPSFLNTWVSKMYLNRNLLGHQLKKSHAESVFSYQPDLSGVGYQRRPFNDTWVLNLDNQPGNPTNWVAGSAASLNRWIQHFFPQHHLA